jgi:hypothetical protein
MQRLVGASAVLAIALFAACGGKVVVDAPSAAGGGGMGGTGGVIVTGPPPPDGIVASSSTGPTTAVVSSVVATTTVGVGGTGGGAACPQAPDCFQCCADQNPGAYEQFVAIVVKLCACGDATLKCFMPCSNPNQNTCADPQLLGQA